MIAAIASVRENQRKESVNWNEHLEMVLIQVAIEKTDRCVAHLEDQTHVHYNQVKRLPFHPMDLFPSIVPSPL